MEHNELSIHLHLFLHVVMPTSVQHFKQDVWRKSQVTFQIQFVQCQNMCRCFETAESAEGICVLDVAVSKRNHILQNN